MNSYDNATAHGVCYSHFSNEVHNGAYSIVQQNFINDCYKVNPIGQWGKFLVMTMGFVDHLGQCGNDKKVRRILLIFDREIFLPKTFLIVYPSFENSTTCY